MPRSRSAARQATQFERKKREAPSNGVASVAAMNDDLCWSAVVARDERADGTFVFAVRTTGIYCRPSCGARRPRRENVRFFAEVGGARAAGFRACKRCRPDGPAPSRRRSALVARVCKRIDDAIANGDTLPRLAELAAAARMSPFHLQRTFRASTGLSPRAYGAAVRAERARAALGRERTVTRALHTAGYGSTSGFYATAQLGMPPRRHRTGRGERIAFATERCRLGVVLVASTDRGLCAIHLGDDDDGVERELRDRFPRADVRPADEAFAAVVRTVVEFVDGERTDLDLPLDVRGTSFQQRVWRAITAIPRGATATYGEIAAALRPRSGPRAVARACGDNPLAVAVPCHRVVGADGGAKGYRWGVERKTALLAREASAK